MPSKINWGVLSTAKIGVNKVIPAMQMGQHCNIVAVASRDKEKAEAIAQQLGISKSYGSYDALINDESIDAIYNPLPNHLHYKTTLQCIQAGKHVLCEKPLVLTVEEANQLISASKQYNVKVGEAFMVHTHPQWIRALDMINEGYLGELKSIQGYFCYYNVDAQNIRNIEAYGGGAVWDIGCYPVHISRYIFDQEPTRVISLIEKDPAFNTDRLTSVIMDFPKGHATFTVSTQLKPYQTMEFFGTEKSLKVEIPFNAPADQPCKIFTNEGDILKPFAEAITLEQCDQYTIQGDAFSLACLNNTTVPVDLENARNNTAVLNAIYKSAQTNQWETPELA